MTNLTASFSRASSIHMCVLLTFQLIPAFLFFILVTVSSEDVTSSSIDGDCPRFCQCFIASYSSPPQSWQIKQYMHEYQWEEGSKVVGCWGRGKIPRNISPDTQYLLLLGNGKVKRRDKETKNNIDDDGKDRKSPETIQSLQTTPVQEVQTGRKWRQIKTVSDESFSNMGNLAHLDLSGNKVQDLSSGSFLEMKYLITLSLRYNRLKKLPEAVFSDLTRLRSLDLSGNNMRYLPSEIFRNNTNLLALDLSDNLLNYLPERSLHWLMHLQHVNISYNRLLEIPDRLLMDLVDIKEIYLDNNKLRVIAYDMFRKNVNLEVLSLRNNRIRTLEEYAFYYQNNLRRLDLSGNKLIHIPNTVFWGTQAMLWLDLSRNNISEIEDGAFARIQNLTELVLSDNRLDSLTSSTLDELPKLRKINLARNNITDIGPGSMQGLKVLEVMDLSSNCLETVEAHTFYGLKELRDLHLGSNIIKKMTPEAFKVSVYSFTSKLTWLNLQGNDLSYLEPNAFYGAPNVKILNLANNNINSIVENSFHGLMNLRSLKLGGNKLKKIETVHFKLLSRLESLDLDGNDIESLDSGSLEALGKLRELNLEDNYLNNGPNNFAWTIGLDSLEELNLNKNGLELIPPQVFSNLPNLRVLSVVENGIAQLDIPLDSHVRLSKLVVAQNELRSIGQSLHRVLQAGSRLDFSMNPWHCDCALASNIQELITSWRVTFNNAAETTCSSPEQVKHRLLHNLIPDDMVCAYQNGPFNGSVVAETDEELQTTHSPCHTTYRLPEEPNVWPWHAVLWNTITQSAMCNGALIGPNWILSTLRCLEPHTSFGTRDSGDENAGALGHIQGTIPVPRHWVVKLGKAENLRSFETHEQIYSIRHVHVAMGNETIADWNRPILIELSSLASLSQHILPICPADDGIEMKRTTLTGWGSTSPRSTPKLLSVNFTSLPECPVRSTLRDFICTENNEVANIRYSVYRNHGAPLVTYIADSWFLVGIVTDTTEDTTKLIDVRPFDTWLHDKMV